MESAQSQKLATAVTLLLLAISIGEMCNGQGICNMSASSLMECKPAVSSPNPAPPTANCCKALSHADLNCLCSYKNSDLLPSLGIDPNLALQLPDKCKLPHPSRC